MLDKLNAFLEFELIHVGDYVLKLNTLLFVAIIIIVTKLLLWLIKKALFAYAKKSENGLDDGTTYALNQIVSYFIWIISIIIIFEAFGVEPTVLIGGSAALLVGIGMGMQHIFNDVLSGVVLLSEGTIKVGDVLEVDGDVMKITKIGLRTSKGLNRDEIIVIIPNSIITSTKVINWSHNTTITRFKIQVGVAYGSDVDLVMKVLKESVMEHNQVIKKEATEVRFIDFGNSSLDFQVMFYSNNIFKIEKVKSDIRMIISREFTKNNISIPFPQMDIHMIPSH